MPHFKFVWRNLRRLGVPVAGIDDAVQDVFVVVHRRLKDFEPRYTVRAWLYRILGRIARDHRRRMARKSPHERSSGAVRDPDAVADEGASDPAADAERAEGTRVVLELLGAMNAAKRDVFILAELEEMDGPEIAQALGVPLNTVYSRLRSARHEFEQAVTRFRARESRRA